MTNSWIVIGGVVALLLLMIELFTYSVGDRGRVSQFYKEHETFARIIGIFITIPMIWKGNTPTVLFGIVFLVVVGFPLLVKVNEWSSATDTPPQQR